MNGSPILRAVQVLQDLPGLAVASTVWSGPQKLDHEL